MVTVRRAVPFSLAGALALGMALACGDSGGPGSTAASVTGIAGDSQVGSPGAQLPLPLSFIVLNGNGQPLRGASVTWSAAPLAGATLTPATGPTDADGIAATSVRLGTLVGEVVITGKVQGLQQPVTFHVLVLDPCANIASYTLGTIVNGALASTDCNIARYYNDFYALDLPQEQQSLRINMTSDIVDSWVELYRLTGEFLGFHDDIVPGVNRNSQLDVIAAPGGSFVIAASSWDTLETGPYSMVAALRTAAFEACGLVWVTRGVSVIDAVQTTDCVDSTSGPGKRYFDFAAIWLNAGMVIELRQQSVELNPRLELRAGNGALLVANDDSVAGTTTAFISYTVPSTGPYVILPGTSLADETGAYTLDVRAPASPSGPTTGVDGWGRRRVPGELLRFGPVRLPKGVGPLPTARRSH